MATRFEWDEAKRQENLAKHDVDFERAVLIFARPIALFDDDRVDYGEVRKIAIGLIGENFYVVVHTVRGDCLRIISARLGGRRDRRKYHAYFAR